jgi:GntR family phosphonate transport system transcriptional regulator
MVTGEEAAAGLMRGRGGEPLWSQLAERLAEEIRAQPEDAPTRLPGEHDLARRYGVNRHTVRQALRSLAEQGLVQPSRGRGTFITERAVDYPLGPRTRFGSSLIAQEMTPVREILSTGTLAAPPQLARLLAIEEGAMLIEVRSRGLADRMPLVVGTLYLSAERFPGAAGRLAVDASVTSLFESYGIDDYRRRTTRVTARLPTAGEARLLRQATTQPVLETQKIDADTGGRPLSFGLAVWASERVQLSVEP